MNDLNDLLENTKWSDTGLDNRLTPEDWNEIVVMTYDLSRLALEVMDYAIEQEKRGIGG